MRANFSLSAVVASIVTASFCLANAIKERRSNMKITIIRGLPGSGKSTLGRKLSAESGAVLLEQDMFRVRDGAYVFKSEDRVKEAFLSVVGAYAKFGADIILTGVFATCKSIEEVLSACRCPRGSKKTVSVIHCANNFGTTHDVPEEVVRSMRDSWEDWGIEHAVVERVA
jgi:hypothetical protein